MEPINLDELAVELGLTNQATGDTMTELDYLTTVVRKAVQTAPHDANAQANAEHIAAALIADGWTNPEPA